MANSSLGREQKWKSGKNTARGSQYLLSHRNLACPACLESRDTPKERCLAHACIVVQDGTGEGGSQTYTNRGPLKHRVTAISSQRLQLFAWNIIDVQEIFIHVLAGPSTHTPIRMGGSWMRDTPTSIYQSQCAWWLRKKIGSEAQLLHVQPHT